MSSGHAGVIRGVGWCKIIWWFISVQSYHKNGGRGGVKAIRAARLKHTPWVIQKKLVELGYRAEQYGIHSLVPILISQGRRLVNSLLLRNSAKASEHAATRQTLDSVGCLQQSLTKSARVSNDIGLSFCTGLASILLTPANIVCTSGDWVGDSSPFKLWAQLGTCTAFSSRLGL